MELSATFPKALSGQTKSTKHMHYFVPNHIDVWSPSQNDQTRLSKWLWIYEIVLELEINPFPSNWVLRALIAFTLSNARRFYSSMGNLSDRKGLINEDKSDYRRYDLMILIFFRLYFHYCLSNAHTCKEQFRLQNETGWRNGKMFAHQTFPFGPWLNRGIKPIYPREVNNWFCELICLL